MGPSEIWSGAAIAQPYRAPLPEVLETPGWRVGGKQRMLCEAWPA
jgi:hypothetical protein